MAFAAYEDNGIALAGYAYICWQAGCGRWYEPQMGYFDIVNGARVVPPPVVACPTHKAPMYERHFDFLQKAAQLRCPHWHCAHGRTQELGVRS